MNNVDVLLNRIRSNLIRKRNLCSSYLCDGTLPIWCGGRVPVFCVCLVSCNGDCSFWASRNGHIDVAKQLLEGGADLTERNFDIMWTKFVPDIGDQ